MGLRQAYKDFREVWRIRGEIVDLSWEAGHGLYKDSNGAWDLLGKINALLGEAEKYNERTGSEKFDLETMRHQYDVLEFRVSEEILWRDICGVH